MKKIKSSKPVCQLSGTDGNVFSIIGKVSATLKRAGQKEKSEEFLKRAREQDSYDDVLMLVNDYVEVE